MIALFAAPLLAAAGMAYANAPPACVAGVDCAGYRPANPNVVFAQEPARPQGWVGYDQASRGPAPVGYGGAAWGPASQGAGAQSGGYAYAQAAYTQQSYGQSGYARQSYGYAAPAYAIQGYEAQGYVQAPAAAYAPPPQAYAPAPAAYGYGQAAYGYGGYQNCNTCQVYAPPAPPPAYNPCCVPQPQFQEINVRGDVYSGGVGITDIEGGGGGGGGGNFEVQGFGDISNFVSSRQQIWANATANANANANASANAYANASNSVNIDISNNFKFNGGKKGYRKPTGGCDTCGYTPPANTGCDTCSSGSGGGVGMGGWGGHKGGGHMGGYGGGYGGCSTCGSSSGGSKMGGWGRKH